MTAFRNPQVRETAISDVRVLARQAETEDHVLADLVEEIHHLFDPTHGWEPGDILANSTEVELAAELWHALERATFPMPQAQRAVDPIWREVAEAAATFAAEAGQGLEPSS